MVKIKGKYGALGKAYIKRFLGFSTPKDELLIKQFNEDYPDVLKEEDLLKHNELNDAFNIFEQTDESAAWGELEQLINGKQKRPNRGKVLRLRVQRIAYAACASLILFIGVSEFNSMQTNKKALEFFEPGSKKAVLIRGNGVSTSLNDGSNGLIYASNKVSVNAANNKLVFAEKKNKAKAEIEFNTLTTPEGGYYQVVLEDGSKVWLNSSSSLKFPNYFEPGEDRIVQLQGEGFFDITTTGDRFIVQSNDLEIEVLGTQFNMSAYGNDKDVKVSLFEGKVRVDASEGDQEMVLTPMEKAVYDKFNKKIDKKPFKGDAAKSWIVGRFYFKNKNLDEILKQASRWYGFTYAFEDRALEKIKCTGVYKKEWELEKFLSLLSETTGIQYEFQKTQNDSKYELIIK